MNTTAARTLRVLPITLALCAQAAVTLHAQLSAWVATEADLKRTDGLHRKFGKIGRTSK